MSSPARPLLVFDGDCTFCRAWIERWRRVTGEALEYAPYQEVAPRFPDVPVERFRAAVQLFEPDRGWSSAAEAVFRSLAYAPGSRWGLWLYRHVPGFAAASEACYRVVATHRDACFRITRWIWGRHVVPPGQARTSSVFLRLLGLTYGVAFVSLWTQVLGLAGSRGVLSIAQYLAFLRPITGASRYWLLPTLCWLDASDGMLLALCAAGTALSALLVIGIAPIACLIGAWVCYLSLATACQSFLWYQWDSLLLEAGFLAIFLAPWRWRARTTDEPPRIAQWLLRWLLFRLMLASAAVKLSSGDSTWLDLTALRYHYWTQPLPPWTAWYANLAPAWFQALSAVVMFAVEGAAPFLLFTPRRLRFAGAFAIVGLQLLIALTGNYGFFNLLTIALCVLWLDDGVWPGWRPREIAAAPPRLRWPRALLRAVAVAVMALSLVPLVGAFHQPTEWLGPVQLGYRIAAPLRLVNGYGLFAVMTKERREIEMQGSADGVHWLSYEFPDKPGDVRRRPRLIAPHLPRLDWQMWFAALGDYRGEQFFLPFSARLLEGSPQVTRLLAGNPFPNQPPRFLRALAWDYRFTDRATRRRTGAWWSREPLRPYAPVLALRDGQLVAVESRRDSLGAPPPGELGSPGTAEPDTARSR